MTIRGKHIIIALLLLPLLTNCSLAYRVLLGIDTSPNWKWDKAIAKQAKRYKIPSEYNLTLDTVSYYSGLGEIYNNEISQLEVTPADSSAYKKLKKVWSDDNQPVHFRLFDKEGTEVFKIVNCYVDPPIPMNWNVEGCFDTFPPQISDEALNTHYFGLDFLLSNASTLDQKKLTLNDLPESEYYGVILWNDYFKRPSRKLIKTVRKKIQEPEDRFVLIYIHNQNAFLWQHLDPDSKETVKAHYAKTRPDAVSTTSAGKEE